MDHKITTCTYQGAFHNDLRRDSSLDVLKLTITTIRHVVPFNDERKTSPVGQFFVLGSREFSAYLQRKWKYTYKASGTPFERVVNSIFEERDRRGLRSSDVTNFTASIRKNSQLSLMLQTPKNQFFKVDGFWSFFLL
ncbi:unnamed protein product [Nesidiocoris tenuis]|uniref:Uncharacterized protein n=1 Tax=Nesidiocoris tenuis TaxID=355587 RepID=A0A6H5G9Y8_9HEMI|nr:unnamed protein product [Nesidiocoris tenuis]